MPDKPYIQKIVLRESAINSLDPNDIFTAAFSFYSYLTTTDWTVHDDDLPREVALVWQLHVYVGDVCNGGHEQFFGPLAEDKHERVNNTVELGLTTIGAPKCLELFKRARAYVYGDSNTLRGVQVRQGFDHPKLGRSDTFLSDLDGRFFALKRGEENIVALTANYVRSLPILESVPDKEWKVVLDHLIEANPLRSERLAEKERRRREGMARSERAKIAIAGVCQKLGREYDSSRPRVWYQIERRGKSEPVFCVNTDRGKLCFIASDHSVEAFDEASGAVLGVFDKPPDFPKR